MRPARLAVLLGALVATAALYLHHLAVDEVAFRALTGASVPTLWQELGGWGRPAAVLLAAALVAVSFRPGAGPVDRVGSVAGLLLAAGALAGGVLARQAAVSDASVVSAALGQAVEGGPGASAGPGFWLLLAGAAVASAGSLWDLIAAWRGRGQGSWDGPGSVGEEDPAALQ